jgi:HlyD family secretion protein
MVPETEKIDFTPIEIPRVRRDFWGYAKIAAALLAVGGGVLAWQTGYRPSVFARSTDYAFDLVTIDRGDVEIVVVEQGTLESASNTTVRCQVEALIGTVGGADGGTAKAGGQSAGGSGQGSGSGSGGSAQGGSGAGGSGQSGAASTKSSTKKKAGSSSTAKSGTGSGSGSSSSASSSSGSSSSKSSSSSSTASTGSASGGSASGGGGSGGGSPSSGLAKPTIRSFSYQVTAHTPLRPVTPKAADSATQKKGQQGGGAGGRGGGRGGRGGRGSGGGMMGGGDEKPGSTRILEIVPEGTRVKSGDIVAKLDGAAYVDELQVQKIRFLQAKSYVEQANSILEVNEITLKEYRDGIYPQDLQLIRQYVQTCQLEKERLDRNLKWSQDMLKKGFRTTYQVTGDRLSYEQAAIAFNEASGMLDRLSKQTGPKIIKELEANVRAIQSDKLTQDASFSLEEQRLSRIVKNIEHCTVTAPSDGIVVYVNQTDRWGQVTAPIDEGVTLRQDQPIFSLPDPKHMRVKARINESKVILVHSGQRVLIAVDAFPDRKLRGTVREVTQISTPLNASDVRVYYANIDIDQGFDDLRPGLSAEVILNIESRPGVTRVPLRSVRWVGEKAYVALYDHAAAKNDEPQAWRWRPVDLGLSDTEYAEVASGLQVGDVIVAIPRGLPAPTPATIDQPATSVADLARDAVE